MSRMTRQVVVGAGRLERWIDGFSEQHGGATTKVSPTEVHLAGADEAQAWLTVPFAPLPEDADLAGFVAHVTRRRRVGVLLVRRGGYAVGVFDGTELAASKTGSSYVQGSTKAGGWSQQRFARRRANQARAAFEAAADAAAAVVLPAAASLDAVVAGGHKAAVDAVLADARLAPLGPLLVRPFLAVADPRLRVLQQTPEMFTGVRVRLDP
jgi:Actinobacteria/chloroflexi VLRF1 release factor